MNKLLTVSALAVGLMLAGATDAKRMQQQNIDFGTITCQEFLQDVANSSEDDIGAVMLWIDGYLSGVSGDTELRFDGLEQFGTDLVERCQEHGKERLLDAARKVGIE